MKNGGNRRSDLATGDNCGEQWLVGAFSGRSGVRALNASMKDAENRRRDGGYSQPVRVALPHWKTLATRFTKGQDCLAAFLAYEGAEILAGSKPANLVNLTNRLHPCGRNLYSLWQLHGEALLARSGLAARVLIDRGSSLLLMLYAPSLLDERLVQPATKAMLRRARYEVEVDTVSLLDQLQQRCRTSKDFPHEIGIFIGYPLKDVAAFLGWVDLPFTVQGPWKIYGRAEKSLQLAEEHRRCRAHMLCRLCDSCSPIDCLILSENVQN